MEPKNILFVSSGGQTIDAAWRIKEEGNAVKYYIEDPEEQDIGEGFVERIKTWEDQVEWADLIILDDTMGKGKIAQELREKGKLVVGGTPYTDRLEDERSFGQDELKKHGINIIPHHEYTSFEVAITYVKEHPGRYVIKPSGEAGSVNKGLLFVGEEDDGRDVIQVLSDYKKAWEKKITSFQLQKRVTGVEIAVGAFFNGKQFLYPLHVNFENKKLFPGNLGPSTGEMGTHCFWSSPNKIFNQTLRKFENRLAEEGYVGYIDLNCIVNGYGIYPLEFTARFGFPTLNLQQEGLSMPVGEFFYRMAAGEDFSIKTKSGFQVCVNICVPPFPFEDDETFDVKSKDSLIYFKKKEKAGVHLADVRIVNDEWLVSGTSGIVVTVTGSGSTMEEARKQCYSRIKNILIPHMYYRDDIGERWREDSDRLHSWGYLREN